MMRRLEVLEREADSRHEQNLSRFETLTTKVATISGELKVIIGLLVASGGLNLYNSLTGR